MAWLGRTCIVTRRAPGAPQASRMHIWDEQVTHRAPGERDASRMQASDTRRTTHVVEFLPERVRLVGAPGALRNVELSVLGWRTEGGETVLVCRLVDGSPGTIPARWTDLPARRAAEPALGVLAAPQAWRLLGVRLAALKERCPGQGQACRENGGGDVRAAGSCDQHRAGGGGGDVGDVVTAGPAGSRVGVGAVGGASDRGRA